MIIQISGVNYYLCDRSNPTYSFIEHKNKMWTAGNVLRQDVSRQDTLSFDFKSMPLKEIITGSEKLLSKFIITDTTNSVAIGAMTFLGLVKGVGGSVIITDKHFYSLTPFYAIITLSQPEFIKAGGIQHIILNMKIEEC